MCLTYVYVYVYVQFTVYLLSCSLLVESHDSLRGRYANMLAARIVCHGDMCIRSSFLQEDLEIDLHVGGKQSFLRGFCWSQCNSTLPFLYGWPVYWMAFGSSGLVALRQFVCLETLIRNAPFSVGHGILHSENAGLLGLFPPMAGGNGWWIWRLKNACLDDECVAKPAKTWTLVHGLGIVGIVGIVGMGCHLMAKPGRIWTKCITILFYTCTL